jgi:hypothetical protein
MFQENRQATVHNTPLIHKAPICRETGKEYAVKVWCEEGLANYPGPKPYVRICAGGTG